MIYRFNRIFEPQKHDCNDKTYFSGLEETSPYLRKPFPRKILYFKTLTHVLQDVFVIVAPSDLFGCGEKHLELNPFVTFYSEGALAILN